MKNPKNDVLAEVRIQGATVLISAIFSFLQKHGFTEGLISTLARDQIGGLKPKLNSRKFRQFVRAYEEMGMVLSTWYSNPVFLDREGNPVPLCFTRGSKSIRNLVRLSKVRVSARTAFSLMQLSSSIKFEPDGLAVPIRRVFVLPNFEIPRATLVVERFLDTLQKNSLVKNSGAQTLLERSCHVTSLDLERAGPILRDIKERGTAFMDSIDDEIEARRRTSKSKFGELGLLTFAWTKRRK